MDGWSSARAEVRYVSIVPAHMIVVSGDLPPFGAGVVVVENLT